MPSSSSLEAHRRLKAKPVSCSVQAGWRSLLLRGYEDPPTVEPFSTAATTDQLLVLVTGGAVEIDSWTDGRWQRASYRPGHLGMTAPMDVARLRWQGLTAHRTLHLHVPGAVMVEVAEAMRGSARREDLPSHLVRQDPALASIMVALAQAARAGAPDLYAETAAYFVAAHLLEHHGRVAERPVRHRQGRSLRLVDEYMRANLASPLSLAVLAEIAGLDRFQLLRAANAVWGETPLRRLVRLRMALACRLLKEGRALDEIATACGYGSAVHFATAFKRTIGMTPSHYRRTI